MDLDFSKSEWGVFYADYRELEQHQLQKKLLHFDKQKSFMIKHDNNPYQRMRCIRHLFRDDPALPKYSTNIENWMQYKKPFNDYLGLMVPQFEEVRTEYLKRKMEHENLRKEKRTEKIECDRCHIMVSRCNLSKHRKSKKCLETI